MYFADFTTDQSQCLSRLTTGFLIYCCQENWLLQTDTVYAKLPANVTDQMIGGIFQVFELTTLLPFHVRLAMAVKHTSQS
jgi:hypothetical protein